MGHGVPSAPQRPLPHLAHLKMLNLQGNLFLGHAGGNHSVHLPPDVFCKHEAHGEQWGTCHCQLEAETSSPILLVQHGAMALRSPEPFLLTGGKQMPEALHAH